MNRDGSVLSASLRSLLATILVLAAPASGFAQNLFRPAPRPLRIALTRAREAISEERFADAVSQLGEILTADSLADAPDSAGQDFFYDTEGDATAQRSIKTLAELWLGQLPKEARELFELKYGGVARATAEKAIETRDFQLLNEVTRKYFFTEAGHEAALILARRHLDEGRPFASASLFDRIRKSPDGKRYEPQASLLAAMSWRLAGLNERAEDVLQTLRAKHSGDTIDMGATSVPMFDAGESPLKWLEKHLGPVQRIQQSDVAQWAMHRGGADRNASASGGLPLVNFRWRTPTSYDPDDERLLRDIQRQNEVLGAPTIPTVSPLAIGDTVLMRSARRLVAVDFESGKRVWEFPWDDTPDERAQAALRRQPAGAGTFRYNELQERLLEDATYGQIAAERDKVFLISDLTYATSTAPSVTIQFGGVRSTNRNSRKVNQLVSLNLRRQGAIHWVIGGEDGWDEPQLAECFFLGAPLPIDGRLYVLYEQRGEIQLGALDSGSGKLLWRQQLARVDERDIGLDAKRRLAGASPTYADGILVCPTSAGAVVAIDLATRALRWGRQYQTPPRGTTSSHLSRMRSALGPLANRWLDASVTAAEGKVLLTPIESPNVLICLDLFTGNRLWSVPRDNMTYLACVHNGRAILVGVNQIRAVELNGGGSAWDEPIALGDAMPSGRGFRSGDRYYLPTSKREILEIDLAKAAIVRRVKAKEPLGNLLAYRGGIISQGVEWLSAYYQLTPLMDKIDQRLKANPDDAWALARRCELLIQEGRRKEALEVLERTAKIAPNNPRVRRLMIDSLLTSLETDFEANREAEAKVRGLIDSPTDQARLLRALAVGFENSGEKGKAVEALVELSELPRDELSEFRMNEELLDAVAPAHRVRRERWVRTRIASLLADESASARLNELLPEKLKEAKGQGDAALTRYVELYGPHSSANQARLLLAQNMTADGRHLAAELLLAEVVMTGTEEEIALAEGQLAKVVESSGRGADAAQQYLRLRDKFAEAAVDEEGLTGAEAYKQAREGDSSVAALLNGDNRRPMGRVDVEVAEVSGQVTQSYHKVYPFRMLSVNGPQFRGLRLELDQNRAIIRVSDDRGGQFQQVTLKERPRLFSNTAITLQGRTFGHLAVVSVGPSVYAVDTLSSPNETGGPVMWTHNLSLPLGQPSNVSTAITARASANKWGVKRSYAVDQRQRRVGVIGPVTPNGVCFMRLRELICVDPLTGETIWSRTNCPQGAELAGNEKHVILYEADRASATVYDIRDGSLIGERPAPAAPFRLAMQGDNLLWWEEKASTTGTAERILRLTNTLTQEHLYQGRFADKTLGRVLGGDEFLALQPDGKLTVISLRSGETLTESKLAADEKMQHLLVARGRNEYFVGVSRSAIPPKAVYISSAPPNAPQLNGKLHAVSRDGEILWAKPADLRFFYLPEDQPIDSPLLVLMRGIRDRRQNSSANQTSLLVLDKHDGRVVKYEKQATPQIGRYRVAVTDDGKQVAVYIHKKRFTFTLTDEPAPPAPVAHVHDPAEQKPGAGGRPAPNANPFGADPFR